MSSKDKTRAKLMGSMRKTKADAGIETNNRPESAAASKATTPKSAKPAVEKRTRAAPSTQPHHINSDGYQSGRRVWPD